MRQQPASACHPRDYHAWKERRIIREAPHVANLARRSNPLRSHETIYTSPFAKSQTFWEGEATHVIRLADEGKKHTRRKPESGHPYPGRRGVARREIRVYQKLRRLQMKSRFIKSCGLALAG